MKKKNLTESRAIILGYFATSVLVGLAILLLKLDRAVHPSESPSVVWSGCRFEQLIQREGAKAPDQDAEVLLQCQDPKSEPGGVVPSGGRFQSFWISAALLEVLEETRDMESGGLSVRVRNGTIVSISGAP